MLDWAQLQLIERGAPDRAERAWYLAAAALAGGVRDWRYLQRPVDPRRAAPVRRDSIDRALIRFPSDPALRLEQALAAASRFNVIGEDGASTVDGQLNSILPLVRGRLGLLRVRDNVQVAADLLAALAEDPDVGVEARTRLGYLYWTQGNHEASRAELSAAIQRARDPESRYLANFLLGWTLSARGESAGGDWRISKPRSTRGPARNRPPSSSRRSSCSAAMPRKRTRSRARRSSGSTIWIRGGCSSTATIPACRDSSRRCGAR